MTESLRVTLLQAGTGTPLCLWMKRILGATRVLEYCSDYPHLCLALSVVFSPRHLSTFDILDILPVSLSSLSTRKWGF